MRKRFQYKCTGWALGVGLLLLSTPAFAGYDSSFTLGVGIHSGYFHAGSNPNGEGNRAVYGLNLRARLFRVLGLSLAYDLNNKESVRAEVDLPYPIMQLTAHLYFLHVGRVTLNLLGGIGLNLSDQNNGIVLSSYVLGTELAVRVHNHVEINAGLRFYLRSFEQVLYQRAGASVGADGGVNINLDQLKGFNAGQIVQDIFDFRNFQVLISVRAYI